MTDVSGDVCCSIAATACQLSKIPAHHQHLQLCNEDISFTYGKIQPDLYKRFQSAVAVAGACGKGSPDPDLESCKDTYRTLSTMETVQQIIDMYFKILQIRAFSLRSGRTSRHRTRKAVISPAPAVAWRNSHLDRINRSSYIRTTWEPKIHHDVQNCVPPVTCPPHLHWMAVDLVKG